MKKIQKLATLKIIIPLSGFYLIFVLYIMRFPYFNTENENLESLDIRWSYTMDDVTKLFNSLGIEGLKNYKAFLLVDSIYILVYSFLLILGFTYLLERMGRLGNLTTWLRWFPLVLAMLDYTENINTWLMINTYPDISASAVHFGSTTTLLKWYWASICVGLLLCALLAVILRNTFWKWKNKNNVYTL